MAKKKLAEVDAKGIDQEEAKKIKKAKQLERNAKRKDLISSLPFNQIQYGKLINVIDEGNGNYIKQYAVPVKVSKEKQCMLITTVVIKDAEIVSVATSYIPENLRVKVKDGSGMVLPRKLKKVKEGEVDTEEDED